MTSDGSSPDLTIYAKDCIAFAEKFLVFAGLKRLGPRQLPVSVAASASMSLEDRTESMFCEKHVTSKLTILMLFFGHASVWRNKSLLQQSFFVERFSGEYLQVASECQIKLACQSNQILQLGGHIILTLE